MPVLFAHAIEDSTDIFGISVRHWLEILCFFRDAVEGNLIHFLF